MFNVQSMATPTRFGNVTRFLFRSRLSSYPSLQFLHRNLTKTQVPLKKLKVAFGLLSFPVTFASVMASSGEDHQALIDQSEALYDTKDFNALYDLLLPHQESTDANVLWRLARAATEKGKMIGGDERKRLIFEAFEIIKKALELDDKNFACHKWYGILLDYTAEYTGTKQRISNAFLVKEHFMKAIELNPKDATTMYCLGYWCFLFADMAWYERKIAGLLFSSPPTSSYEEALGYFKDAEKAEPGFYNLNNVMIARTLICMKTDKDQAKEYLEKALNFNIKTEDDKKALKEAKIMLKSF